MSDQGISNLLTLITEIEEWTALNAAFGREMRKYGFNAHAAGQLVPFDANQPFFLLNWPQRWMQIYASRGYSQEDVALVVAVRETRSFTWQELKEYSPGASARIFAAAREEFGWCDGLAIPVRGPGPLRGLVSLVATDVLDLTPARRRDVETLATAAYVRARELVAVSGHRRVVLSPREREALACVACGKSDAEIAVALGVSLTTAHAHVERAKGKLGASTRAQAVALAMAQGLLDC